MPARQEISLEPALALVLRQHLHHSPIGAKAIVVRQDLGYPSAVGNVEDVLPAIGVVLVRTEEAKVVRSQVELHHIAEEGAHDARCLHIYRSGARDVDSVVREGWKC